MKDVETSGTGDLHHHLQQRPATCSRRPDEQRRTHPPAEPRLIEVDLHIHRVLDRVQRILTRDAMLVRTGRPADRHPRNVLHNTPWLCSTEPDTMPTSKGHPPKPLDRDHLLPTGKKAATASARNRRPTSADDDGAGLRSSREASGLCHSGSNSSYSVCTCRCRRSNRFDLAGRVWRCLAAVRR